MFLLDPLRLLIIVVVAAVIVGPYWLIWKRTGHSGAWSLFLLLPVTNIAMPYILAFKRWPRFTTESKRAANDH